MKRRLCSLILAIALCLTFFPAPVFAEEGFSNFYEINTYSGQFTDVPSNAWFAESVASAYRLGLVAGVKPDTFNPNGYLRLNEVLALACSIHSRYYGISVPDTVPSHWYQKYVDYALENGIIENTFGDYECSATRAECVTILARSLPESGFAEINNIEYGAIPDVPLTASYAESVYKFYRAGIMQGYEGGYFKPDDHIRRCEIAATLLRVADPANRGEVLLGTVDTQANGKQFLVSYTKEHGTYDPSSNTYDYTFASVSTSEGKRKFHLLLIDKDQRQSVMILMTGPFNGKTRSFTLNIQQNKERAHFISMSTNNGGSWYSASANVYCDTYSENTTLDLVSYTGSSYTEDTDRTILSNACRLMLQRLNNVVLKPNGYDLRDLGFRSASY